MQQKIQFTLDYAQDLEEFVRQHHPEIGDYRVLSKSLDARGSNRGRRPQYLYMLECQHPGLKIIDSAKVPALPMTKMDAPIIVGAGPAGLFCALYLSDFGIKSIILERGNATNDRMKSIARFWRYGQLDPEDNVCFGEGGAGLFSDGKLITRIKSPYIKYVMKRLVDFGAPPETAYVSNPHLGSNRIRAIIATLSNYLRQHGCQIHYRTKVVKLLQETHGRQTKIVGVQCHNQKVMRAPAVFLATGHSAHDIYQELSLNKVSMLAKDFAVGVRMEHPRRLIDKIQHGDFSQDPILGAARYRLSWHDDSVDRGSYSFCMCPGGHVLSSGTDVDGLVTNGMSNYSRSSPWSNSALVVSVKKDKDFCAGENQLGGLEFQRTIEKKAFEFSRKHKTGREIPAQNISDFLAANNTSKALVKTSCPSGIVAANLEEILPPFVVAQLRQALLKFNQNMPGIIGQQGLLLAPETRTSSPVTILRHPENLESITHSDLYPCGEGAGHAGGITSAAVDGIKSAHAFIQKNASHLLANADFASQKSL